MNSFSKLMDLLASFRKEVISIYILAILNGLIQLTLPIGIQSIIGFVMGASMVASIYVLIAIILFGVLFVGILQLKQMDLVEKISQKLFVKYTLEYSEYIPKINLREADNYYLPEKVNRLFDIVTLQKGFSKLLLDIPIASIQIIFGFILLALYHPFFIFFSLILMIVIGLIIKFTSTKGLETSIQESNKKYETVSWIEEMARVIKSFKLSQGSHLNLIKSDKNITEYLIARTSHYKVLKLQYNSIIFIKLILTFLMLTIGTYLLIEQKINIGEFIAAEIVILTLINATEKLVKSLESIYDVFTALDKLSTVSKLSKEIDNGNLLIDNSNGIHLKMKDFSFDYSDGTEALKNINLEILPYQKLCITGKEGSGKSTLLMTLGANLINPSGIFSINSIPLLNYNLSNFRAIIGIYLHTFDIFKGTIFENIAMNRPNVSHEQIVKISNLCGFENFIQNLPLGLNTEIESYGKRLSSSMIRKILLLRTFCHQPSLILLEEPWLGLSTEERRKLIQYLLSLDKCTVIVATNDKDFAKQCDQILELKSGKLTKNAD